MTYHVRGTTWQNVCARSPGSTSGSRRRCEHGSGRTPARDRFARRDDADARGATRVVGAATDDGVSARKPVRLRRVGRHASEHVRRRRRHSAATSAVRSVAAKNLVAPRESRRIEHQRPGRVGRLARPAFPLGDSG